MAHGQPGRDARLLHGREVRLHYAAASTRLDEPAHYRVAPCGELRERMLRGDGDERDAHDRVGPRREDLEFALAARNLVGKGEVHALAAPDPVRLHGANALGPLGEPVEPGEQFPGVVRDPEVVHRDLAPLDGRAGAPAAAVDHLLVGEHGLVHGIPVDGSGRLVGDAALEHPEEQPLVPPVIAGVAGREFARPVDAEAERHQLRLHVGDVVAGPLRGRDGVLDRGVLGGQAECVPAHGLQDVAALHAHVTGERVADGVVAHVPHVQLPARVGEHAQAVVLRLRGVLAREERAGGFPLRLDLRLDFSRFVALFHRNTEGYLRAAWPEGLPGTAMNTSL